MEAEPTSLQIFLRGQGSGVPEKDLLPTPGLCALLGEGGFMEACKGCETLIPVNIRHTVMSDSGTFHI